MEEIDKIIANKAMTEEIRALPKERHCDFCWKEIIDSKWYKALSEELYLCNNCMKRIERHCAGFEDMKPKGINFKPWRPNLNIGNIKTRLLPLDWVEQPIMDQRNI